MHQCVGMRFVDRDNARHGREGGFEHRPARCVIVRGKKQHVEPVVNTLDVERGAQQMEAVRQPVARNPRRQLGLNVLRQAGPRQRPGLQAFVLHGHAANDQKLHVAARFENQAGGG